MERGGFLQNLTARAAALAASAIPYGFSHLLAPGRATAERNYLRPPGALEDPAAFVAACIGCGLFRGSLPPSEQADLDRRRPPRCGGKIQGMSPGCKQCRGHRSTSWRHFW